MRYFLLLSIIIGFTCTLSAQVSDAEVIEMTKAAYAAGKSQQEIATMLASKGVTQDQALRIKNSLQNQEKNNSELNTEERNRSQNQSSNGLEGLEKIKWPAINSQSTRFGHSLFNNQALTFEPNLNIPTPENYKLGAGDEVIIDLWGDAEKTVRQTISAEGSILVENLGPIYLNGLSIRDANQKIKHEFSKIHADLTSDDPRTFIQLTLGKIRSIRVNIIGEATLPGTFTLPSLATVYHALYATGGANDIGTLRAIKVLRNGKLIQTVDVYRYLISGDNSADIRLQDGDNILIEPYQKLVGITGPVKRPMQYEMKPEETLENLLQYVGGFTGDAYTKNLNLIRKGSADYEIFTIDLTDISGFVLADGDKIEVGQILERFTNQVTIRGAVYRPGSYALSARLQTLTQLINMAEGVTGDAFLSRALLYRENPDLSFRVESVDLDKLFKGEMPDIPLQNTDTLYIPSIYDLAESQTISVQGAVNQPGKYPFIHNMALEEAILQAGGLQESASIIKVEVSRRQKNPTRTDESPYEATIFTLTLQDGLITEGPKDFTLKPFDEIFVRHSPGYVEQQNVHVQGEVLFEGTYTKTLKDERLSSLIERAGGLTSKAYVKGARLVRQMNEDERRQVESVLQLTQTALSDSISTEMLNTNHSYYVGIDLKQALNQPGSDHDIVLRTGDHLIVPVYSNTVKISGAVMHPNIVTYSANKRIKDYVSNAGGFAHHARKRNIYVVYMNGMVEKCKGNSKKQVEPGCEIIVPLKPEKNPMGLQSIMSLATSATSMAALVTSIINTTK